MCCIERIGDLNPEVQDPLNLAGLATDLYLEGVWLQILHGDKWPLAMLPYFVHGADVRVVQRGGRACLSLKSFENLRIARHLLRQELQGYFPTELEVFGFVDFTHSAAAKETHDLEASGNDFVGLEQLRGRGSNKEFVSWQNRLTQKAAGLFVVGQQFLHFFTKIGLGAKTQQKRITL